MRIEELYHKFLTYLSLEHTYSPLTTEVYKSDG